VAPDVPLDMFTGLAGPITTYMSRTLGAATALAAVGAFCLKDAAERHVLHYKTFRLLNTGLAASNALQALVLLLAVRDGWADPSRWVACGWCCSAASAVHAGGASGVDASQTDSRSVPAAVQPAGQPMACSDAVRPPSLWAQACVPSVASHAGVTA
jgi:hypothetical protein